jgi:hypothetical protein
MAYILAIEGGVAAIRPPLPRQLDSALVGSTSALVGSTIAAIGATASAADAVTGAVGLVTEQVDV